jgi:hypothetical protein
MRLFDAPKTLGIALAEVVKPLLEQFKLQNKIIAYVKDEGSNLRTLERALTDSISCAAIGLKKPYSGVCFGHVISKAYQYATTEDKVCIKMKEVSLKNAQTALQKTIIWTKKSTKGRHEWDDACAEAGLPTRKLKTPMKITLR